MVKDTQLQKIFAPHKVEISDNGFSKQVVRQLPKRKSALPQIVMVAFVAIGLALTFSIQGVMPMIEQIKSFSTSIGSSQMPSMGSLLTYLYLLFSTGIIGYGVARAGSD